MGLAPDLADLDFCYLTTTGRRTARAHTIEIWFAVDDRDDAVIYLLAGGGDRSDWVRNLVADPAVTVRIAEHEWPAEAAPIPAAADRAHGAGLVFAKYQPRYKGDLTEWRDSSLLVSIRLMV